jgi:iron complex outermembrane receptor protein
VGTYTDFQNVTQEYRPFSLTDVRLSWHADDYSIYAEANNVFNKRNYVDYGNVPQPGTWIVAGVQIKLKR